MIEKTFATGGRINKGKKKKKDDENFALRQFG